MNFVLRYIIILTMSKTPTFNMVFTKFFTIEKYEKTLKEYEDETFDVEIVQKIIHNDLPEFIDTLTEKMLKSQVNKYGFYKACCEFNADKSNKGNYLFQNTGSKSKYSEECEIATYKILLKHIIVRIPVLMNKLVKLFKKAQNTPSKKKKNTPKIEYVLEEDESKIEYDSSGDDN